MLRPPRVGPHLLHCLFKVARATRDHDRGVHKFSPVYGHELPSRTPRLPSVRRQVQAVEVNKRLFRHVARQRAARDQGSR